MNNFIEIKNLSKNYFNQKKVTVLRNLWTDNPPVYFAVPDVGKTWFGPDALSPKDTVVSSPKNREPYASRLENQ